jgi:succinyl-diaminopimelate desuccinylase
MPVVPDGARASTMNINSIHGGEPEPEAGFDGFPAACVADRCRIVIDRRFLIEEDIAEVKHEVRQMLEGIQARRPGFSFEIRELHEVLPTVTHADAPVVKSTAAAIEKVLARTPDFICSPGTYDQKHIDRIGRLKNCIAYGPGILDLAHQPDEWVGIDDMVDSAQVLALVLYDLLVEG